MHPRETSLTLPLSFYKSLHKWVLYIVFNKEGGRRKIANHFFFYLTIHRHKFLYGSHVNEYCKDGMWHLLKDREMILKKCK